MTSEATDSLTTTGCAGVTRRMPLCRCTWLYHCTKPAIHSRASSSVVNPSTGYQGRYLQVRNSASKWGLSLLTRGWLKDGVMPSSCSFSSNLALLKGLPLSA